MRLLKACCLTAASVVLFGSNLVAADRSFTLVAKAATWPVASSSSIPAYAYNGTVPGPELRVTAGDHVRVTLVNELPEATTIHWHGIPVPNGMDGVPGVSAPVVPPGGTFAYEFKAPDPGTYWYHPHADAAVQIARGLYGLLIVDPSPDIERGYDREVSLVIGEAGAMGVGMGMAGRGMSAGAMTDILLINGKTGPAIPRFRFRLGEQVLFRMVNTGNMVHPMHIHGLHWTVIATDGFAVPAPYRKDTLPINAGERYDALLVADNPGTWMLHCHNLTHTGDGSTGLSMEVIVDPEP